MERKLTTSASLIEDMAALRQEVELMEAASARTRQPDDEFARFFAQSLDLLCIAGFDGYFKRNLWGQTTKACNATFGDQPLGTDH